jgi:hypothetical protein
MPTPLATPHAPTDDKRWRTDDARIRKGGRRPDALIEVLHSVQEAFGYLDTGALEYVSASLGVPPSRVFGVVTFYSYFALKPQGARVCVVCTGTACYINGASRIGCSTHLPWARASAEWKTSPSSGSVVWVCVPMDHSSRSLSPGASLRG